MEAKEILQKVKEFFNELTTPEEKKPVKMSEYQLKDGGMVQIEELAVGGVVMIDGAPALPGELELVDGTKIVVGENGVISEIKPASAVPPAEAPETPSMDMGSKFAAFEQMTAGKFSEYENKFAAYESKFADYEVKLNKATKVIEELLKLSTLLADAPAATADPVVKAPSNFKEEKKINYNALFTN